MPNEDEPLEPRDKRLHYESLVGVSLLGTQTDSSPIGMNLSDGSCPIEDEPGSCPVGDEPSGR